MVAALTGVAVATAPARAVSRDIPDLALVVAERTVTLRSGDREFALLWQLLGPTGTGTERVPEAWTQGRYPPVRATVVWGLTGIGGWPYTRRTPRGDVAIERQDQVVVAADGTVWVRSDPAPDVVDGEVRWRRVPRAVFEQLDKGGVFGPAPAAEDGSSDVLRWGAVGLGAGVALGVGGTLAVLRRAAARRGAGPPRQELIDLGELG
ncbi:hypothetical protein AAW14_30280 [Streptomyces hygroscopicus]|uniref:hypothetical protein n=1 Tax=Streptomyces hygroscopicus TaxID=1912 RepID=UPI00223FF135|nr:hypothetical protein [Streptomyces hygroscopicus]MCW7946187.1 hypothetical protein [Streptomyces hygroscopicus]